QAPIVKGWKLVNGKRVGGHVVGYRNLTPEDSRAYMDRVASFARSAVVAFPSWEAVVKKKLPVRISFYVVRNAWRGDIDNYQKIIFDALGQARVIFFNDNRIVEVIGKVFTDKKAQERLEIRIEVVYSQPPEPVWCAIAREHGWRPPAMAEGEDPFE